MGLKLQASRGFVPSACDAAEVAEYIERRSNNKKEDAMNLPKHLLPTTVVGSYPQPDWLVDRAMLSKSVPRTRMHEMWRLPAGHLEAGQGDAALLANRGIAG